VKGEKVGLVGASFGVWRLGANALVDGDVIPDQFVSRTFWGTVARWRVAVCRVIVTRAKPAASHVELGRFGHVFHPWLGVAPEAQQRTLGKNPATAASMSILLSRT